MIVMILKSNESLEISEKEATYYFYNYKLNKEPL